MTTVITQEDMKKMREHAEKNQCRGYKESFDEALHEAAEALENYTDNEAQDSYDAAKDVLESCLPTDKKKVSLKQLLECIMADANLIIEMKDFIEKYPEVKEKFDKMHEAREALDECVNEHSGMDDIIERIREGQWPPDNESDNGPNVS